MKSIHDVPVDQRTQRIPTPFVRWMRVGYVVVAGLFVGAIALQVFFAGAGALVHPRYIGVHTSFGHVVQFFPIGLLLLGFAGRLPWRLLGITAITLVLFSLQYVFLWLVPSLGFPVLRALHAVNALALFWITVNLTQSVWQLRARRDRLGGDQGSLTTS